MELSRTVIIAGLILSTLALQKEGFSLPATPIVTRASNASCPLQTAQQWQRFLEFHSDHEAFTSTCEDGNCDEDFYRFVKSEIYSVFEKCAGFIAQHEKIALCTANYRRFLPSWMRQHDSNSYGFDVPNDVYLKAQEAPDKPQGMMKVPEAILAALPDRSAVEEAARKNGYKYLTHDSAIDGLRTFVLNPDPNGRFDQWLLLNLKVGKTSLASTTMPLSVLAIEKKDAKGNHLSKVRLHFRDYDIRQVGKRFEVSVKADGNGKCYACHASGVRQLIARRTPVLEGKPTRGEAGFNEEGTQDPKSDFAFNRLMEFNRRLRSYGQPDWEGKINPADHGAVIGKVQGCTDCHDGKSRGVLNNSTSTAQLEKKVFTELSMPYDTLLPRLVERAQMKNPPLNSEEKIRLNKSIAGHSAMLNQYLDSRLPELRKWLLEIPCAAGAS